jgi:ketosteroid isomerase-like protein
MSHENVEVVRRAFEAFDRGDMEGVVADFGPHFEYVATGAIPGVRGVYRGTEGYRRFLEAFVGEFDDVHVKTPEFVEAGDQVLVSVTIRGRGKRSRAETSWSFWLLWQVRDGKVVRGQGFTSRDEALAAVGLLE